MVGAAVVALVVAVRAPMTTTVLGPIAFGVLHNMLEIRALRRHLAGAHELAAVGGLAALAPAAALSLANPAHHVVVLAHLDNLVPLIFR